MLHGVTLDRCGWAWTPPFEEEEGVDGVDEVEGVNGVEGLWRGVTGRGGESWSVVGNSQMYHSS